MSPVHDPACRGVRSTRPVGASLAIVASLALVVSIAVGSRSASAHSLLLAYVRVSVTGLESAIVTLKTPLAEGRSPRLTLTLSGCSVLPLGPPERIGDATVDHFRVECTGPLRESRLRIGGLGRGLRESVVVLESEGRSSDARLLAAEEPEVALGALMDEEVGGVAAALVYGRMGVEHVVLGLDHLAFVAGLVLIVIRRRGAAEKTRGQRGLDLLTTLTAFTLAHSATLALAVLDLVRVPQRAVEVIIALSIILLATEMAERAEEPTLTERHPRGVAFGFGLVHGLGFAGALRELGLMPDEIPVALVSFNLGVEVGQLAFCLLLVALIDRSRASPRLGERRLETAVSLLTGTLGCYWLLDRALPWALTAWTSSASGAH